MRLRNVTAVLASGLSIASIACTIGEDRYEVVKLPPKIKTEVKTCDSPLVKPDKASLKACGDGKGHCYDKTKVPIPDDQAVPCDGGGPDDICVPDKMLFADGKALTKCKFALNDSAGACVSLMFKLVSENKDILTQDACDPDERCAPCVNPLDGSQTHLCDDGIGPHQDACIGGQGADLAACCHGSGVCMTEEGAPPDQRANMQQEMCPDKHLCAPASLAPGGKPVTCDVLGISGVCLDLCFASMFQATTQITRSSCGPTEVCMPCAMGALSGMKMPGC
jgi:hypothetical protein